MLVELITCAVGASTAPNLQLYEECEMLKSVPDTVSMPPPLAGMPADGNTCVAFASFRMLNKYSVEVHIDGSKTVSDRSAPIGAAGDTHVIDDVLMDLAVTD